jgi:hypothetical protein
MKSRIWCTCVTLMLVVWTPAFGEILETYDWWGDCGGDPEYSSPSAYADGDNNADSSSGDGWEYTYTTEGAFCEWSIYVYAYAEAHLWLYDGDTCSARADASASGSYPMGSWSQDASVSISDSGYGGEHVWDSDIDEPSGISRGGQFYFEAYYDGVSVEHTAYADAGVPENSDCEASSHACAQATGGMSG